MMLTSSAPSRPVEPAPVRRFTLLQALVMLGAAFAAYVERDARFAALPGVLSLAVLASVYADRLTPAGRFGAANTVTTLRVLLVVLLSAAKSLGPLAATAVVVFTALDGLDGWLARRAGSASEFGARFDMETDALLVLVAGLKLAEVGRLGAWIVAPGLLRYAYAAVVSVLPRLGEAPRSRFGRAIAGLMMTSLALSAWPVEPVFRPLAAMASLLVGLSFARSAVQSITARA